MYYTVKNKCEALNGKHHPKKEHVRDYYCNALRCWVKCQIHFYLIFVLLFTIIIIGDCDVYQHNFHYNNFTVQNGQDIFL